MKLILSSGYIRDIVIEAIQSVINANNDQINTIMIFDPQDPPQCHQDNIDAIDEIKKQNHVCQRYINTLKTMDGFNIGVLKTKMYNIWFQQHMPYHINVSYDTKLKAIGTFDTLIRIGFQKLTGCNQK